MEQKRLFPQGRFEMINKAVYFPSIKTLAIGDLHLGHEFTVREAGSLMPATQMHETKKDIEEIFIKLKKEKKNVEKVVFLGDVKHFFSYEKGEKSRFLEIMLLVTDYVKREDVIIIKGNHEKWAKIADKRLFDYCVIKDIAFIHGDVEIDEVFDKRIKTIVMGHLHPAVSIRDPHKIKREKYKCYLTGEYKKKEFIILPSFLPSVEGAVVNRHVSNSHCIVPVKNMIKFRVFVVGENEVFDFGELRKLVE